MARWTMIGTDGCWEYWIEGTPDERGGDVDTEHRDVYRRRASVHNVTGPDGEPMGARWECRLSHWHRFERERCERYASGACAATAGGSGLDGRTEPQGH